MIPVVAPRSSLDDHDATPAAPGQVVDQHPLGRVASRLAASLDAPFAALLVTITVWVAWLGLHVWRRHDRFSTFDNDLGFHTQFVWLISRGKWFSTILGLPAFGHNATFGYFLLAPFTWLGAGPQFLDLTQTLAIGLGAIPVYLIARDRLGRPWPAVALGIAWLLHPVVVGNVWETFHPEAMAMTPLLGAYCAAVRGRWTWYGVFLGLALIWKSDVSLFVLMLGVLVAWRWNRRAGLATIGVAAIWFVAVVMVMIPRFSGGGTVFGPLYGDLGDSPTAVMSTAVHHPTAILRRLGSTDPERYARDLLAPYAFVPVLGLPALALGAPQYLVSLLSDQPFTHDPFDNPHYQALSAVALTLGLIEGLVFLRRRRVALLNGAVGTVVALSLACSTAWAPVPWGVRWDHYWQHDGSTSRADKLEALQVIGPDASVSAQYLLVSHLAQRERVYSFPNPWRNVFYGVQGTKEPNPSVVRYLVVDHTNMNDSDKRDFECIVASGAFRTIFNRQSGIHLLERSTWPERSRPADLKCQHP